MLAGNGSRLLCDSPELLLPNALPELVDRGIQQLLHPLVLLVDLLGGAGKLRLSLVGQVRKPLAGIRQLFAQLLERLRVIVHGLYLVECGATFWPASPAGAVQSLRDRLRSGSIV